uniref:ArsO family NAD(P)H-dependent flavin-containing monooxygenase n=1 Tax=Roseihalotalea indica TaxID=2867963 RepID=A0AA49GME7_9BACT|nr:ArsO family NAD(P)H-dependent flavin-containing monooxygenase [Tunicatimonas sp. TK19036]
MLTTAGYLRQRIVLRRSVGYTAKQRRAPDQFTVVNPQKQYSVNPMMNQILYDVIIIGGGQSALAVGYYLRKTSLNYLILDDQKQAGGSWPHYWESLRLFSPAQYSSLPGVLMPGGADYYPSRDETIEYLQRYEERYDFPIKRPVRVLEVKRQEEQYSVLTSQGEYRARTVVSATGSFREPHVPTLPGQEAYQGVLMHSSQYQQAEPFSGKQVIIVGEGNSGAQILAEVSQVAETTWVTLEEPTFLPDEITGRTLFDYGTAAYEARKRGESYTPPSLGNIVSVPKVIEARQRGVYQAVRPFDSFTENGVRWPDGREQRIDAVIFCTGFRPALSHLSPLGIVETSSSAPDGKATKPIVATRGTRALNAEGLWLVGYGSWTGFASATLIGVGRSAKQTVSEIQRYLQSTTAG